MAVGFIGSNNEFDVLCDKAIDRQCDDSLVDYYAPRKILPGFFELIVLEEFKSLLLIFLLAFLSLLKGAAFCLQGSPVEYKDWLDVVIGQHIKHFEDVVKEVDRFDVLVELHCTAVTPLIYPWHGIYSNSFVFEG